MLQYAINDEERLADDGRALAIEEVGTDDDVRDAGLVLEREEHKSFRGARTLPGDDHAGDSHATAIARAWQIGRAHHATQRQIAAAQRHRMRTDGEAHAGVISPQPLA